VQDNVLIIAVIKIPKVPKEVYLSFCLSQKAAAECIPPKEEATQE
jgi:hypothetical protein